MPLSLPPSRTDSPRSTDGTVSGADGCGAGSGGLRPATEAATLSMQPEHCAGWLSPAAAARAVGAGRVLISDESFGAAETAGGGGSAPGSAPSAVGSATAAGRDAASWLSVSSSPCPAPTAVAKAAPLSPSGSSPA
eukprot:5735487-Prymnesium_polylepis.1